MENRHHIVIVEDNDADVFLIREAIRIAGTEAVVDVISDGRNAADFFAVSERCPDLVLLDLNLPKMSGDLVLRSLREHSRSAAVKVIILTSSESLKDRETVSRYSISGYFIKPSEFEEFMKLGALIRNVLNSGLPAS